MNTFAAPKFSSKNGWDVMIDNSYPFLGIPNYIAHSIAKYSGAEYDEETDSYYISCDAKFTYFMGIGSRNYTLESSDLISRIEDGRCTLNTHRYTKEGYLGAEWVFGVPFLRKYCHVFNMEKKQIGFAHLLN
ncbi:hypothetical protein ANCCAN_08611 [Ancylostoma caninum]|uniref:Peptidase A1 domain-containing protein n=1 Tax=Ancylostoma caninum TaxID=29170 RepID=A0A368GQR7_ANCCA|nr:hypothetical protein ANCCAN_08611 [Ancylostoma caninum]